MQAEHWQRKTGRRMAFVASILFLGLLTWLFDAYLSKEQNPNREFVTAIADGQPAVHLQRNRQGHYVLTALINGQQVEAMLDTGATTVGIPGGIAKNLDLTPGTRSYSHTANGLTAVFSTVLDSVQIGGIRQESVRGSIIPSMNNSYVLIGMSFLQHLKLIQEGDTLILQTPQ